MQSNTSCSKSRCKKKPAAACFFVTSAVTAKKYLDQENVEESVDFAGFCRDRRMVELRGAII